VLEDCAGRLLIRKRTPEAWISEDTRNTGF